MWLGVVGYCTLSGEHSWLLLYNMYITVVWNNLELW